MFVFGVHEALLMSELLAVVLQFRRGAPGRLRDCCCELTKLLRPKYEWATFEDDCPMDEEIFTFGPFRSRQRVHRHFYTNFQYLTRLTITPSYQPQTKRRGAPVMTKSQYGEPSGVSRHTT